MFCSLAEIVDVGDGPVIGCEIDRKPFRDRPEREIPIFVKQRRDRLLEAAQKRLWQGAKDACDLQRNVALGKLDPASLGRAHDSAFQISLAGTLFRPKQLFD